MGAVYLAKHSETGATVAFKLLNAIGLKAKLRFQREGEAQAAVDRHPNVIRIRSAGQWEQHSLLVMDAATTTNLDWRLLIARKFN